MKKIIIVYGCRPDCLKLYPVIRALKQYKYINVVLVNTQQQKDLSDSFTKQFNLTPKYELNVMIKEQSLNHIISKTIGQLDPVLLKEKPDLLIVQGDVSSSLAAALAAFNTKIPVAHVEAGLRTDDMYNPYPEEINRRLITQLATYHFSPTLKNYGFSDIFFEKGEREVNGEPDKYKKSVAYKEWVVGNTIIDVIKSVKPKIKEKGYKQILLTLHRRENLEGELSRAYYYLDQINDFLTFHNSNYDEEIRCKWVTHPNASLKETFFQVHPMSHFDIKDPMAYDKFINECFNSDLILSDSGGCQEETTIIKKPLFILRENTERSEVLDLPFVRLIKDPMKLYGTLNKFFASTQYDCRKFKYNIFGDGKSGERIAKIIATKILK